MLTIIQWKHLSIMIYLLSIELKLHLATKHLSALKTMIVKEMQTGTPCFKFKAYNIYLDNMIAIELVVVNKEYQWDVLIHTCTHWVMNIDTCLSDLNNNLDCQWIDITDVPPGHYLLRLHANPGNQVAETDFYNNIGKCSILTSKHANVLD